MRHTLALTAFSASFWLLGAIASQAALPGTATRPSFYEVTITQVEMCQDATCSNPFKLGVGSRSFDISSAFAGADVGSYIDITGIPLFQTWSHVRVTFSSTIRIGANWTDADGDVCGTGNALNQASGATALLVTAAGASTNTPVNMVIPDVGAFAGNPTAGDFTTFNMTKAAGAATASITYPLTSPYTCKGVMPRIEVRFDTGSAFSHLGLALGGAAGQCHAYPRPPAVTITASDP